MRQFIVPCAFCGADTQKSASEVNRAKRVDARLFCDKSCAGQARRSRKTREERRAEKARYDKQRREELRGSLLKEKREAYRAMVRNRSDELRRKQKEQRARQKASGYRNQYIRSERYKKYKHEYDTSKRSRKRYGEFAECHRLLLELEKEIRRRCPDKYERLKARGYYERQNEKCRMKRLAAQASRNRSR